MEELRDNDPDYSPGISEFVNPLGMERPKKGDKTLHERLSTPRSAPKIVLKSAWKLRQQQQQQDTLRRCGKPLAEQLQGNPTDDPHLRGSMKPVRGVESLVAEEERDFKVYLSQN